MSITNNNNEEEKKKKKKKMRITNAQTTHIQMHKPEKHTHTH